MTDLRGVRSTLTMEEYIDILRVQGMTIGENVDILDSYVDNKSHAALITIGSNVTITHATLLAHDACMKKELGCAKVGRIDIGDDVFIGWGAIILPNTRIGNRVIVGAGAVVRNDIPDNSVVIGNPAEIICTYDEYMEKCRKKIEAAPKLHKAVRDYLPDEQAQLRELLKDTIGFE